QVTPAPLPSSSWPRPTASSSTSLSPMAPSLPRSTSRPTPSARFPPSLVRMATPSLRPLLSPST
ncbi:hypothetical protein BN1723_020480, partial [Verticillium longisporum]